MTAPPLNHSTDIEGIESQIASPQATDFKELKLDGADIPEDLRGKSVADLVQMQKQMEQALRLSEQGRQVAQQAAEMARLTPPPAAAPVPVDPELAMTDEQLAELLQTDSIRALRIVQKQTEHRIQANLDARVGSIAASTAGMAEREARQKYPEVFEVLGPEIKKVIDGLPDKSVLHNSDGWDQLVGYVRGQKGNFEKIVAHAAAAQRRETIESARRGQEDMAGISFSPTNSAPTQGSPVQADEYTREIARNLGMSIEEYDKWRKIT